LLRLLLSFFLLLLLWLPLLLLLLFAILPASSLGWRSGPLVFAPLPPAFLLELSHLALHEAARLRILLHPQWIVTAVRTTPPAFGIRAIAVTAENAFRKGHLKNGRIVHFRPGRDRWTKAAARRWRR
jgi:hypothetical protein